MADERGDYFPRPPRPRTTTDFIVVVFVVLVATVLVIFAALTACIALFTDDNVGPYLAVLTDLMATIIAALVGFLAGRGAARVEGPP